MQRESVQKCAAEKVEGRYDTGDNGVPPVCQMILIYRPQNSMSLPRTRTEWPPQRMGRAII